MFEVEPGSRSATVVTKDSEVTLNYTLSTEHEILDTTVGLQPLTLRIGAGQLHPAIENCLMGLKEGESFERLIHHSLAFGERNPDLRILMKRASVHEKARNLQVGDSFEGPGPDRKSHIFRVIRADQESFTIDGNHPLAGIDLQFEGKILKVSGPGL